MNIVYRFKKEECPFCSQGLGTDDREMQRGLYGVEKPCKHSFTYTEYGAMKQGIKDTESELRQARKIVKKMKEIIDSEKDKN